MNLNRFRCISLALGLVCSSLSTFAQTAGDYRSVANGTWATIANWETYDGAAWQPAVAAPTSAATVGVVTIRNGNFITNAANVTMDQIVVEAGATLAATANLTVANGTGTDLDLSGNFVALGGSSCLTIAASANVAVQSGGVLLHNGTSGACVNNSAGVLQFNSGGKFTLVRIGATIPTATWNTGSTCEVAYIADGAKPATAALVQNFADFTVNCPNQTATGWDFAGQLTNHVGKFTVNFGSGPNALELKLFSGSSSSGNLIVGGDFTINNGQVNIGSSGGPWALTVASNITVAAGADFNVSGSASASYSMILNGTGTQTYTCNGTNRATKLNWTVNGGSTLSLANDLPLSNAGRILTANGNVNLNGKTILADLVAGSGTIRNEGGGSGKLIVGTGGGTNTLGSSPALLNGTSGTLGLVKSGGAALTITSGQTFGGGLVVSNGSVFVDNATGSGTGSGAVSAVAGSLGGTGIISGAVNIGSGATLAPGHAGLGTLTISNTLTLGGTTTIEINRGTGNDQVKANTINYGGTLNIVTNGTPFVAGDTFQIFAPGSVSGSFSATNGSPGANLAWAFNPASGVLSVASVAVLPPALNVSQSGNTLTFSWSEAGFKLQSQTNSLSTGLNGNWGDYPDLSNPVNVSIDPTKPTVFFRLSQ